MAVEPTQHQPSIAEAAGLCFDSFQKCMQQAGAVSPRDVSIVEGQCARFSLWAANIAVFAPGRASLDHRLREAPEVHEVVTGLLEVLNERIKECSSHYELRGIQPDTLESHEKQGYEKASQEIANQIALLHRLSNTIRKASSEAQNIKAARSFDIVDEAGNDVEPWLRVILTNYVRDKFRGLDENILQRLVSAMILRRKRVLYRRHRFGNVALRTPKTNFQPTVKPPDYPSREISIGQEKAHLRAGQQTPAESVPETGNKSQAGFSATTLAPEKFRKASTPSAISTAKTVALNDHEELPFPAAPLGGARRRYNEMRRAREREHAIYVDSRPSMNSAARDKAQSDLKNDLSRDWEDCLKVTGEVTCPFCCYALPAIEVNDSSKWKSHVKNDLDAYVCLFQECDTPDQLYKHSEEWLKHMREHALRWRCNSKSHGPLVFGSRDQYTHHMTEAHRGAFSDAQIRILANRSGRASGTLFESCPFCGWDEFTDSRQVEEHVVGHLRFLALKSLPPYQDDLSENFELESASSGASKPHRRSTIDNDPDRHIKVTFEDHGEIPDAEKSETLEPGRFEWDFVTKHTEAPANVEADPVLRNLASKQLLPNSPTSSLTRESIYTSSYSLMESPAVHHREQGKEKFPAQTDEKPRVPDDTSDLPVANDPDDSQQSLQKGPNLNQLLPTSALSDERAGASSPGSAVSDAKEDVATVTYKQQPRPRSPPPTSSVSERPKNSRHDAEAMKQRGEIAHTSDDIKSTVSLSSKKALEAQQGESILVNRGSSPIVTLSWTPFGLPPKNPGTIKELDLDGMINRLLAQTGRVTKTFCLTNEEIILLCNKSREHFLEQPTLLELAAPVKVVGDIHGQYTDLLRIFLMCGFPPATNYLFLGDYVDRGKRGLETIALLLCYKLKYPENFFLLRGNHECANVTRVYGFYDECKRRTNIKIWKTLVDVFNSLPIAAIVAKKIFCVHGGLSPSLSSMNQIREIARPTDVPDYGLMNDLLWSDPADMEEDWEPNERGVSYCFGKKVIQDFLRRHDFDLVCRAHLVVEDGYEFYQDRILVTIFSASNYCGEFDNWGAVMNVSSELLCSFELLKPEQDKSGASKVREGLRGFFDRIATVGT